MMSSIKAPNFRDVIPACCYNCRESFEREAVDYRFSNWFCQKYSHLIEDAGLKICDDYLEEEY